MTESTESTASLVVRVLVRLSKVSEGPWAGLVDLAHWFEERMPREVLEELLGKLEAMDGRKNNGDAKPTA